MNIRPLPRLSLEPIILKMPDFSLLTPERFKTNRAERKSSGLLPLSVPLSMSLTRNNLVQDWDKRVPWQPPFPTNHPDLEHLRDYLRVLIAQSPAQFLQTDAIFHEKSHDHAVKEDKLHRWWARWLLERRVALDFSEEQIYKEIVRLQERFAKSKAIAHERTHRQFFERIKALERFERSRDLRWQVQHEWAETRAELIKQGFMEAERVWDWRKGNLFTLSDTGLVARLPVQGRPLEDVLGELHHKKILAILERDLEWRFETSYATLPNGGMTEINNGAGFSKELISDFIVRPVKTKRTEGFRVWHGTRFRIESPNHVPIAAPQLQGQAPELIGAEIQKPTIDQRAEDHRDFHRSGNYLILPNQSLAKAPDDGKPIELVTAEAYWPERDQMTAVAQRWRDGLQYTVMTNGSYGRLPKVGETQEKVVGDLGEKVSIRQTGYFERRFLLSDYEKTPNGGFAPMMSSGDKVEVVSGDQASKLAQQRSRNHLLWLWTGKHLAPTAQGSGSLDQLDLTPGVLKDAKEHQQMHAENIARKEQLLTPLTLQPPTPPPDVPKPDVPKPAPQTKREFSAEKPPELRNQDRPEDVKKHLQATERPADTQPNPTLRESKPALKDKALKAFQSSIERDGAALSGRLQGHVGGLVQAQDPKIFGAGAVAKPGEQGQPKDPLKTKIS